MTNSLAGEHALPYKGRLTKQCSEVQQQQGNLVLCHLHKCSNLITKFSLKTIAIIMNMKLDSSTFVLYTYHVTYY